MKRSYKQIVQFSLLGLIAMSFMGCIAKKINVAAAPVANTVPSLRQTVNRLRGVFGNAIAQNEGDFSSAISNALSNTPASTDPSAANPTSLQAMAFLTNGICSQFVRRSDLVANYKINTSTTIAKNQSALLNMALSLFTTSTSIMPNNPDGIYCQSKLHFFIPNQRFDFFKCQHKPSHEFALLLCGFCGLSRVFKD